MPGGSSNAKMADDGSGRAGALCGGAFLAEAVQDARRAAKAGDVVLLSPACAAFDQFKNFMVRGKTFKALVQQLDKEDAG